MNNSEKVRKQNKGLQKTIKSITEYCVYCGKKLNENEKTIDHIKPISKNGKSGLENMVCCCKKCNQKKMSNKIPEEILLDAKSRQDKVLEAYRIDKKNRRYEGFEKKLLSNKQLRIFELRIVSRKVIKRLKLNIDDISNEIECDCDNLEDFLYNDTTLRKEFYQKLSEFIQNELMKE